MNERQTALLRHIVEVSRKISPEHPERVRWEYSGGIAKPVSVVDGEGHLVAVVDAETMTVRPVH
jgi:hypothetical protein